MLNTDMTFVSELWHQDFAKMLTMFCSTGTKLYYRNCHFLNRGDADDLGFLRYDILPPYLMQRY